MNAALLEQIVHAVLYEGYILYPYRPSSKKNHRERFTFGRIYPEAYSRAQRGAEPCVMQTECLVETFGPSAALEVRVRFLQPMAREIFAPAEPPHDGTPNRVPEHAFQLVPELRVDGQLFQTWHEAVEREVKGAALPIPPTCKGGQPVCEPNRIRFSFQGSSTTEPIRNRDGQIVGEIVRRTDIQAGTVELAAAPLGGNLFKITVRILNQTPVPDAQLQTSEAILMQTMASAHTILHMSNGAFISLLNPPAGQQSAAAAVCRNIGAWPVLVGNEARQERDTLLSSPIILYDYPKIAPESAGQLFDGTEIDEILTLRILTMTEQEKSEMRQADELARRLLERTEALPQEALMKLHGALREPPSSAPIEFDDFFGPNTALKGVTVNGVFLRAGDRVRLRPKARADVMDMALAGQTAIIEAVEQDLERRVHLAVVVENDPGKDLGLLRQPGHRFFYGVDEVEPLQEEVR